MSSEDQTAGCPYGKAWVVLEGWERKPVYIMPSEVAAKAYVEMQNINSGRVVRMDDYMRQAANKVRRSVVQELDRSWTSARDGVIWPHED